MELKELLSSAAFERESERERVGAKKKMIVVQNHSLALEVPSYVLLYFKFFIRFSFRSGADDKLKAMYHFGPHSIMQSPMYLNVLSYRTAKGCEVGAIIIYKWDCPLGVSFRFLF